MFFLLRKNRVSSQVYIGGLLNRRHIWWCVESIAIFVYYEETNETNKQNKNTTFFFNVHQLLTEISNEILYEKHV